MDWITQIDFNILYFIQDNLTCGFLDFLMPKVTLLGDYGVFWILIAVVLLIIKKHRKTGVAVAVALILTLLVGNALLKNVIARDRPCWIDTSVALLIGVPSDYSFPSGHSMASFAAAVALLHYHKRVGVAALVLAAIIALSRLYLFVHFPTDVIAGTLIGIGLAIAAIAITEKITGCIKKHRESKDKA